MTVRSMSIYLLNVGRTVENSLDPDHDYQEASDVRRAPNGTRIFVQTGDLLPPWWKAYFGITGRSLTQRSNSAVAFIPIESRLFALTFGSGHHAVLDDAVDQEFGRRVVLNSVDPHKLKSADTLNPESSQRRRTQMPFDSDLALLSFTADSNVLKSLTGRAKDEYREIANNVTGSSSLRITTPIESDQLPSLLGQILEISSSEDYLETFPDVTRITPVTDIGLVSQLDEQLLSSIFDEGSSVSLSIPEILDYSDESFFQFSGLGASLIHDEAYIENYRDYLQYHGVSAESLSVEGLKKHRLVLLDGNEQRKKTWSAYKALIFDVSGMEGYTYHLSDGTWYQVSDSLVAQLREFLDPYWVDTNLPDHKKGGEGKYNSIAGKEPGMACLDKTNISLPGQTQVEPCDLIRLKGESVELIHVKLGTDSGPLSHLFNQGVNSVHLLLTELKAIEKLVELVESRADSHDQPAIINALREGRYGIMFAIVTRKCDFSKKSDHLPIFSRISLRRQLQSLRAMRIDAKVQFVRDVTKKEGKKKTRKKS